MQINTKFKACSLSYGVRISILVTREINCSLVISTCFYVYVSFHKECLKKKKNKCLVALIFRDSDLLNLGWILRILGSAL